MDTCDICQTNPEEIVLPKEVKGSLLYCTCPVCNKKVAADIFQGQITCPACGTTADWKD